MGTILTTKGSCREEYLCRLSESPGSRKAFAKMWCPKERPFHFGMAFWVHGLLLATTASFINHHVPEPYMDEIFHIPQAQRYCRGDFATWDPKLTTPPGLYLISTALSTVASPFGINLCTVESLRAVNLLFSLGLYPVIRQLVSHHTPRKSNAAGLYALALTWFPVLYFYNFAYYTDAGSTFLVLLSYLFVKQQRFTAAGLVGMLSVTFRQTNIIWVIYFMALASTHVLKEEPGEARFQDIPCDTVTGPGILCKFLWRYISLVLCQLPRILVRLWAMSLTLVGFAIFLIWNGAIVLGDRSNHIAGLHFPQLFYFVSFTCFFAAPWLVDKATVKALTESLIQIGWKGVLFIAVTAIAMLSGIRWHTYEHPFLLSDNRHYTFYIWKNMFRRHWALRYLYMPIYMACGWVCVRALLLRKVGTLFLLGYMATLVLTLVPSPLLEFRYFIIPFLYFAIQLGPPRQMYKTVLGLIMYLAIHIVTVYLYVYRPFVWPQEPHQLQRFMW